MKTGLALAFAFALLVVPIAPAQGKPQVNKPVVMGTKQLPGEFGKFGTTYTIGKEAPLNFTLVSAEYRADRFVGEDSVGETHSFVPLKGQKLLVIKYTVQNPRPVDTRLWYMSFEITAVSGDDQNTKILNHPWIGSNKRYQDMNLKPAEKVTLTAVLLVNGEGETPKLIVQRAQDPTAAVIRYDLRGKVAKMTAPYSEDGYTALDTIKAKLDTYYAWNGADFKVIGFEPVTQAVRDLGTPKESTQYALKLGFRGVTPSRGRVWYGQFKVFVKTTDGDLFEQKNYSRLVRMGSGDSVDTTLPAGEEANARFIIDMPANAKAAQIKINMVTDEGEFRTFVFDLPASH